MLNCSAAGSEPVGPVVKFVCIYVYIYVESVVQWLADNAEYWGADTDD